VTRAERRYEGHKQTHLAGRYAEEKVTYPAGTFLVRSAQPLSTLAAYLLEPESDDGFATWNVINSGDVGAHYPIDKLMRQTALPSRLVRVDGVSHQ
jgi:hypothetical protein